MWRSKRDRRGLGLQKKDWSISWEIRGKIYITKWSLILVSMSQGGFHHSINQPKFGFFALGGGVRLYRYYRFSSTKNIYALCCPPLSLSQTWRPHPVGEELHASISQGKFHHFVDQPKFWHLAAGGRGRCCKYYRLSSMENISTLHFLHYHWVKCDIHILAVRSCAWVGHELDLHDMRSLFSLQQIWAYVAGLGKHI